MGTRISINKLCRGCMNVLNNEDERCPLCGFDRNEYTVVREHLRLDCILKGKYLVGACIKDTQNFKYYIGWNLSYDVKVVITEYFPKDYAIREDHESGQVMIKKNVSPDIFKKNVSKVITQAELQILDPLKSINITESFQENGTAYYIAECHEESPEEGKREVDKIISYELIKASDFENALETEQVEETFRKSNIGFAGGYVPQPALHVQPAMSEQQGTIVKNVASNVLSGASVSYEKSTRPKALGVQYVDINMSNRDFDNDNKDNNAKSGEASGPSTVSFTNAQPNTQESDHADNGTSASSPINKVTPNKSMIIASVAIVVFLLIALKFALGGAKDDGSNDVVPVASSDSANATDAVKPTDEKNDKSEDKSTKDETKKDTQSKKDTTPFKFTQEGSPLAKSVSDLIGVKEKDITVGDIKEISSLNLAGCGITDITDLKSFSNLKELDLSDNVIEDITPLKKLKKLEKINIRNCGLTDVSVLNELKSIKEVNALGEDDLVKQLDNVDYVVGREQSITIKFIYSRKDKKYDNWSIWVWTAKDPGGEITFEENEDGTVVGSKEYLLTSDNVVSFKLKHGNWDGETDDIQEDRSFNCISNKEGTVITITIKQNKEEVDVNYQNQN